MKYVANFLSTISDEISDMRNHPENTEIAYHDYAQAIGSDLLQQTFPYYDWTHLEENGNASRTIPDEVLLSKDVEVAYYRSRFHGIACLYAKSLEDTYIFVDDDDLGPLMELRAMLSWGRDAQKLKRAIALLNARLSLSRLPDPISTTSKPYAKLDASDDEPQTEDATS